MRFTATAVQGVAVVEIDRISDDRGFFARAWCRDEFARHGLNADWVQANVGRSTRAGTLRGMHYQRDPHAEVKLVRCTSGAVYDVALDLRPSSPSHRQWVGVTLRADEHTMLYIPEGCAHGYQTLTDDAEIVYFTSCAYVREAATGARYDDPAFGIQWPVAVDVISEQDAGWDLWA
ncbi:MAG: dTDP-4-dehydrorhamnose 3,5-epimerase [Egibacteraceae bacterium]